MIGAPQQRKETMKSLLFSAAAACALSTSAFADETVKWRHVQHIGSLQTEQVDDVTGHSLYVYQTPGIAFFPDGSTGSTLVIGTSDLTDGSGAINGYYTVNFPDGSALWLRYAGTVTANGKSFPRKGTSIVIGGKGRYAGARGEGTFEGDGTPAITPTTISYIDNVITLTTGDQADAAKAMLTKAVAAIKADREVALAQFNKGEAGFKQGDLYPYCYRMADGKAVAGGVTLNGTDLRTVKDANGKAIGLETYAAGQKPEGQITEVNYVTSKFGTTEPVFPKVSFVTRVADLVCGVGYYK
jgi:hypothetical protein